MPKNIVILCDGTSNEVSEDRTNILRLYGTLKKDKSQIVFYDPGVGTFGAANAASYYYRRGLEIWGLATGWGLDQNVKEAYKFLVQNYDDGKRENGADEKPDDIYMFGFSRGAYTARVLAGFIHAVGLIEPINMNLLDYVYQAFKDIGQDDDNRDNFDPKTEKHNPFAEIRLFERMLRPKRPTIKLLGLFDTVGSVIESGRRGPRLRSHAFTKNNRSVEYIRHAIAIDEKRTMFQPQLWPTGNEFWPKYFQRSSAKKQNVKEVWFSGVHADIGGGYPEVKSGLAKIPLEWMIKETKTLSLRYKTQTINEIVLGKNTKKPYLPPNPMAKTNKSMTFGWAILEWLPRKVPIYSETKRWIFWGWYIPFFEQRNIPANALIHSSVFERRGTVDDIEQPNIPKEFSKV